MNPSLILLLTASVAGFFIAGYIHHKKATRTPLVCPLKASCDKVVYSPYATFLGIPIEIIGLFYYGIITVSYAIFFFFPALASSFTSFLLFSLTTAAFLFSAYLTVIQALALREWCSWCIVSALLCTTIFTTATFASPFGFIPLLAHYRGILLALHVLGAAIGLGGATITDLLFLRFLKHFKITSDEADTLRGLSQIIWFALGIIVVSGIGIFLPQSEVLLASPKFLAKLTIVVVLIANGAALNLWIAPRLVELSFKESALELHPPRVHRVRNWAFTLGAISIVSWYAAFVLGLLKAVPLTYLALIMCYAGLLAIGIVVSQSVRRSIEIKAKEEPMG